VLNRAVLRRAVAVVALDRFMAERLQAKLPIGEKLVVLPPWPHLEVLGEPLPHEQNPFRSEQELTGKFVLMYSGNLSPSHPITTFLEAAARLRDDARVVFLFVGGGLGREEVVRAGASDRGGLRLLGYQPLERLRQSLSTADVHLVSMGSAMVGIVHPCKVYGAMAVGRPILLLGPRESHIGDILARHEIGWQVDHGDVEGMLRTIHAILATTPEELRRKGRLAQQVVRQEFSQELLCGAFCDVVEGRRSASGVHPRDQCLPR
jgi:glycosyltransferase involved in cell wall biosynthesis